MYQSRVLYEDLMVFVTKMGGLQFTLAREAVVYI